MQRSYLDYAMSVIVGRALPDVRDGLKPVHRRVLYAMFDGGYRPDRAFSKCSRVVGDVMGKYHPHGDGAIYDTIVRMVQPWTLRYPLVAGQGNFGSAGNDGAAASRYTECKMAPLAMELVRDIDKDTVDFEPNYDGREQEPVILPARFPNLLVNGSAGIAVGMATNIPPHNLREVAAGVQWHLDNPKASKEELLEALMERIKGPDFPTGATILGRKGIEDAYRTGRGLITMRAVVNIEEIQGRMCLVITQLPYQVNPDNLAIKIVDLVKDGKVTGIADIRDQTSGRTGQRLEIVLKRDAVAKVVLNNLYKHTQLQDTFGANMLAIVDGVPRTLPLDGFIRYWATHQLEVIQRRTAYRLREAEREAHILIGYLKALDALDEVIALIRRSPDVDAARVGLMKLLDVDEVQATAILNLQLRRLAALERQKITDDHAALMAEIKDLPGHPRRRGSPAHHHQRRARGDCAQVRRRPSHGDFALRRGRLDRGPHRRGRGGRHDHRGRVRQAHALGPVPRAAAGRSRGAGRNAPGRRPGGALLCDHHSPLAAFLHKPWTRLPREGLRIARWQPRRQGPARGEHARVPAGRGNCPGARGAFLHRQALPGTCHKARPDQEDRTDFV